MKTYLANMLVEDELDYEPEPGDPNRYMSELHDVPVLPRPGISIDNEKPGGIITIRVHGRYGATVWPSALAIRPDLAERIKELLEGKP